MYIIVQVFLFSSEKIIKSKSKIYAGPIYEVSISYKAYQSETHRFK